MLRQSAVNFDSSRSSCADASRCAESVITTPASICSGDVASSYSGGPSEEDIAGAAAGPEKPEKLRRRVLRLCKGSAS